VISSSFLFVDADVRVVCNGEWDREDEGCVAEVSGSLSCGEGLCDNNQRKISIRASRDLHLSGVCESRTLALTFSRQIKLQFFQKTTHDAEWELVATIPHLEQTISL
jgi:hypothetical protein